MKKKSSKDHTSGCYCAWCGRYIGDSSIMTHGICQICERRIRLELGLPGKSTDRT